MNRTGYVLSDQESGELLRAVLRAVAAALPTDAELLVGIELEFKNTPSLGSSLRVGWKGRTEEHGGRHGKVWLPSEIVVSEPVGRAFVTMRDGGFRGVPDPAGQTEVRTET